MKSIILTLFIFCLNVVNAETNLNWLTDYNEAIIQAKDTKKPLLLFFTGSDWCSWCSKLNEDVLTTPEFYEELWDKFVFVKIDFPMHSPLPIEQIKQNQLLQQKFNVRTFPTVVILDNDLNQIAIAGYRPGDGKQYASYLLKMFDNYSSYNKKMQEFASSDLNGKDLKRLFQKSQELGLKQDSLKIIKKGIYSDEKLFFQIELYRYLVNEGKIEDPETKHLRRKLLNADTHTKQLTHYQISLIDFEANCVKINKNYTPEQAVLPLINYIEAFGEHDKENLWRLHMVISQVYLDHNFLNEALHHARNSFECAPYTIKSEISNAIKYIESKLESQTV